MSTDEIINEDSEKNVDKAQENPVGEVTETIEAENKSNEKDWKTEYDKLDDTYKRLYAEFDNFRKRTSKERIDLIKTAGSDVAKAMLPVLDDMERAIANFDNSDVDALKQGITLIFTKLKSTLSEKGVQEFSPIGELFNPDVHEALTQIPSPSEDQKGKIMDVVEKGYKIHDTVIRYPKVVVTI